MLLGLMLIAMIGAIPIVTLAWAIRRFPRVHTAGWRLALPLSHTAVIIAITIVGIVPTTNRMLVPEFPYEDVFIPYLFVPGVHIYWLFRQFAPSFGYQVSLPFIPQYAANLIVMGTLFIIVGGIQWVIIGGVVDHMRSKGH